MASYVRDYLLDLLADNDGAMLYWQVPSEVREFVDELPRDGDLVLHPRAIKVGEGCYEMPS